MLASVPEQEKIELGTICHPAQISMRIAGEKRMQI